LRRLPGGDYNLSQELKNGLHLDARDSVDGTPQSGAGSSSQKSTSDVQGRYSPVTSGSGDLTRADEEKLDVPEFKRPPSPSRPSVRPSIESGTGPADLQGTPIAATKQERDAKVSVVDQLKEPPQVGTDVVVKSDDTENKAQDALASDETRPRTDARVDFTAPSGTSNLNQDVKHSGVGEGSVDSAKPLDDKELSTLHASPDNTIASRRRGTDLQQPSADDDATTAGAQNLKGPMRIDTAVGRYSQPESANISSFTPSRSAQAAMQSSPPERMTTRVSSGALRHKSVSEILGETPKLSPSSGERSAIAELTRDESSLISRRGSFVASPESATFKARPNDPREREKDRSKLSTVVFARHQVADGSRPGDAGSGNATRREKSDENKDYLVPLFAAQAAAQNPTLNHLIASAHKTLSTANHYIDYHESQDCRILKRIYHLQNSNRWSLRQLERSAEPPRQTTHWDTLLSEVKWMRTDFREERKWKLTAARNLAEMCAGWVAASQEVRASLQVKARSVSKTANANRQTTPSPVTALPEKMEIDDTTPELVHSADDETSDNGEDDVQHHDLMRVPAPAALFSLAPEDVLFSMDKTPISEKLLSELPLFQAFLDRQSAERSWGEILDAAWLKPIVPVSKHAVGKIVIRDDGPNRKRSRYEYSLEDEGDALSRTDKKTQLSAEQNDVALFDLKNKHIVDRLHAGHAFRPPSQYPMPSQQFFESRYPSQWTTAEDDELRKLVREYEYNWNAISDFLTSPSLYSSGAERRTPWECFERWESFEGLPGEMDKHSYFRAWRSRKHNARQKLEQGYLLQQQNAASAQILRRRSAEPMHVERRKSDKHYALIGAIAKVVKKREAQVQKQQHGKLMIDSLDLQELS
jgi:chromatin modification-related protein VID21